MCSYFALTDQLLSLLCLLIVQIIYESKNEVRVIEHNHCGNDGCVVLHSLSGAHVLACNVVVFKLVRCGYCSKPDEDHKK